VDPVTRIPVSLSRGVYWGLWMTTLMEGSSQKRQDFMCDGVRLLKNKCMARGEIGDPNVSLSLSQFRQVALDSLAVGSHQLFDPIRRCPELGGCAVDDQDRTSDPRIESSMSKASASAMISLPSPPTSGLMRASPACVRILR